MRAAHNAVKKQYKDVEKNDMNNPTHHNLNLIVHVISNKKKLNTVNVGVEFLKTATFPNIHLIITH